ncbi:MAG: DUF5058 family protein [Firmicutes bacterium]|nr:DUF5058 family protein [Bacillota bacterium]
MIDYLSIANGSLFYICGIIITLLVILQAFLFIRISFREGQRCGLAKEQMFKALRVGVVTSIIPSISAVVALIAMVPVLGIPIPWIRQSIMGSTPYEFLAAGIGANSMGVHNLGGQGYTAPVFASSIWIMTLGSFWAVAIIVFFLRMLQGKYSKITGIDSKWKNTMINAAFLGVFSIFIAGPITTGGLSLLALIAGGVIMMILAFLIIKFKLDWLKEFALTLSMIGAMACVVMVTQIFG